MMKSQSGYNMHVTKFILQDGLQSISAENRLRKMQILRTGTFTDPRYGKFEITKKMLDEMVSNFSAGIRGVIPALDYKHESDDIAAGWFKNLHVEQDGNEYELFADIEMTPKGEKVLADKEFGYVSADFDTNYKDNESQSFHGCVLLGAGLTNRPVIKRMESVIQLSEKEKDPVGEKISKLINEGKSQEQAVAIALEMQREGKLAEGENAMDEKMKEMEAKCADLEAKLAESQKKCGELESKIAEMQKPAEAPQPEQKPEIEVELAQAKKELAEANEKIQLAEKTNEFTKLLSEGKAVEAQRESFMKGDMNEFIAKSVPVKFSESGTNSIPVNPEAKDAEAKILELADKLVQEKKISKSAAISEVLKTNKQLAEKSGW